MTEQKERMAGQPERAAKQKERMAEQPERTAEHGGRQEASARADGRCREIERSIIKTFRKEIWRPFVKALNEYDLIQEGDHIAVCISGGKDSMLLAKCMQEILRHGKMEFGLHFLVMDPGYNPANRRQIEENAALLGIPVTIFESDIFNAVAEVDQSPCYLCARMRRGYLYANARRLGCNKIALGHHFDDVIETLRRSGEYHDAQAAQHEFRGYGADPPPVSGKRGGYPGMERVSQPYLSAVRLPFHRSGRGGRAGGRASLQKTGDEGADKPVPEHQFPYRDKYF